jgi:hypothetical protein
MFTNFPKIKSPYKSSGGQKGNMNKFLYLGPANIRRHCSHGGLTPGIRSRLIIFAEADTTLFIRTGLLLVIQNSNGPSRSA